MLSLLNHWVHFDSIMYVSALFLSFTYNDIQILGSDHLFISSEPLDVHT